MTAPTSPYRGAVQIDRNNSNTSHPCSNSVVATVEDGKCTFTRSRRRRPQHHRSAAVEAATTLLPRSCALLVLGAALTATATAAVTATTARRPVCLNSGKPPVRRARSLGPCAQFDAATCCNSTASPPHAAFTRAALVLHADAQAARLSPACVHEYLVPAACAPCDPRVGCGLATTVCKSFCDDLYDACRTSFWNFDAAYGAIPCTDKDLVCGRADAVFGSGEAFCRAWLPRLPVAPPTVSNTKSLCYDGKAPLFFPSEPEKVRTRASAGARRNVATITSTAMSLLAAAALFASDLRRVT